MVLEIKNYLNEHISKLYTAEEIISEGEYRLIKINQTTKDIFALEIKCNRKVSFIFIAMCSISIVIFLSLDLNFYLLLYLLCWTDLTS
jgi:hypothetical protein